MLYRDLEKGPVFTLDLHVLLGGLDDLVHGEPSFVFPPSLEAMGT
jgi:hypothetical protein